MIASPETKPTSVVASKTNNLFPVFLKLEEMCVLVVGGGNVALEKLNAIYSNSPQAKLRLVAEKASKEVLSLASLFPSVEIQMRSFLPADFENVQLAIIAINDASTSKEIKLLANEKGILVNVADTPHLCDFYLGSIVQKGNLKLAISTNGKSPTIAKRLRETLSELLPDQLENVLQNMEQIRKHLKGDFAEKVKKLNEITGAISVSNK